MKIYIAKYKEKGSPPPPVRVVCVWLVDAGGYGCGDKSLAKF